MRNLLIIVLLLPAFFVNAQEDTTEIRTGTIFVKKPKTEIFIRTKIEFSFVDDDPGYVDKGGFRTGLSKKKKKIIDRNEYTMMAPYPEMEDSAEQASFNYSDFFSRYLDYRCAHRDSTYLDSVTLSIYVTAYGKHEYGIVEDSYQGRVANVDTCLQELKTATMHVLQRLTQWHTGGMSFSNDSFLDRTSYGRLRISVSGRPFPVESELPAQNLNTIKN